VITPPPPRGSRSLLDAEFLRQLGLLSLDSLGAIIAGLEGDRSGVRRSHFAEFADYRGYQPGDDLRLIDWHAYARLGELYVRTSLARHGLTLSLLIDCSRSMAPGNRTGWASPAAQAAAHDKLHYAKQVAAALGAVALLHGDAVRVYALGDGQAWPTAAFSGVEALGAFVECLEQLPVRARTWLPDCLRSSRQEAREWDVAVLLSDLLIPPEEDEALDWLGSAGGVLHIVAPAEEALNASATDASATDASAVELQDAETGEVVAVTLTAPVAERYRRRLAARARELADRCARNGLRYVQADPALPVADLVFGTLSEQRVLRRD